MALMLSVAVGLQQPLVAPGMPATVAELPMVHPAGHSNGNDRDDIRHHWGQYSPYFNSTSTIPYKTPRGCDVTFVQVLARHGSRYPTTQKSEVYRRFFSEFVPRVQAANPDPASAYGFLANYTYDLGSGSLTVVGQMEMAELAQDVYRQYSRLIGDEETAAPFLRAAGSDRVIQSGQIFAQALKLARLDDLPPSTPIDSIPDLPVLVIPESTSSNNTLNGDGCPSFKSPLYRSIASHAMKAFADRYMLPVAEKLNSDLRLHKDDKLDIHGAVYLMDMCAYDTVALKHPFPPSHRTADGTGISPFCALFTDADFRAYDYYQSLGKFYGFSLGNPLGPSLGIGFVNELISRLTSKPVEDHTSTNHTLDSDPKTFPVGRNKDGTVNRVFADFSHDNTITGIHAALGLFGRPDKPHLRLPVDKIKDESKVHGYSASGTVPFGARTVFEKLSCKGEDEEMVRIIVNGRVMKLKSCHADKLGRCRLTKFLKSLEWAKTGGKYEKCFE